MTAQQVFDRLLDVRRELRDISVAMLKLGMPGDARSVVDARSTLGTPLEAAAQAAGVEVSE